MFKEFTAILHILFPENRREEGMLPNSFYETSIDLTLKTINEQTLQTNTAHELRDKSPRQNISKSNPTCMKGITHYDQVGFISV